ncbi:hypothetical protein [Streptomyces caniscabiei]|uniref:hypothetical protein n=1 Tax=Streptomyces caniscabiei TaxID=2746961 RepID=UPI0029A4BFA9|nr:hypothetical protein [Streptomyces caniscabiei]MDX2947970.1 hypothetical protein [Streptomyces caniscabiei]
MNTPDNKQQFENIINTQEWGPYGASTTQPVKPGLTKRGKVAVAIGVTVLAGGGMFAWQDYSADANANQIKAQELALQREKLELERMKEMNKAATRNAKAQATEDSATQKLIEACVDTDKSLVGKQMGVTYSSIVADCRSEYADTVSGSDMQPAGSTQAASDGGDGGINTGLLIGGGVLAGALVLGARKATRSNQT